MAGRLLIREISAFNFAGWPPRVAVAIKAYYDSSGKECEDRITLAGYGATPDCWAAFEGRWWEVLANAPVQPCRYLHMVEARALRKEFSIRKGWDRSKVDTLIDSFMVHCFRPVGLGIAGDKLIGASCTIEMNDYRRACEDFQGFAEWKDPVAICLDFVATVALRQLPEDLTQPFGKSGCLELYFDQNEPYEPRIRKAFDSRKDRFEENYDPLSLVSNIIPGDMRQIAALQAADFLSWHVNRWEATQSVEDTMYRQIFAAGTYSVHYDYAGLVDKYRNRDA